MSTWTPFHHSNGWFVLLLIVTVVAISTTTVRANQEYDYGEYGQDGREDYYEIDQVHEKVKQPPPKAKTNYYEQLGRLVAHKRAHQMVKTYQAKSGGHVGSPAPPSMAPTADSSTLPTESTTAATSTNATSIATMNETMTATAESTLATVNSSAVNASTVNSSDVNSSGMSSETPTTSIITVPAASSNESTQAEDDNADGGTNHGLLWLLLVLVGVCTCATAANFCPIPKLPGGKGKSTGGGGSSSKGADTEKGTSGEQSKRFCLLSQHTSGHISSGQNTSDKKVTSASQKSTPVTPNQSNKASSSSTGSSITSSSGLPTDSSNKTKNGGGSNGKPATAATSTVPSTGAGAGATTTTPTKH